jgi:probable phosphoglycerate mutase
MSMIVLWRHAPTLSNTDGRIQGQLDVQLDEHGRSVAAAGAARLFEAFGAEVRIFSSPLGRAVETAQALSRLNGVPVTVDEAFGQRSYGAWEGLTWDEVKRDWPREFAQREAGLDPDVPGWDGQAAVAARVFDALQRVWDNGVPAVVVSHGSPITLGLLAAIDQPASSTVLGRVPHGAAATLRRVESGAWHIDAFGLGAD